jgi:hypothetical protein
MRKWLTGRASRRLRHPPQILSTPDWVIADPSARQGIVVRDNDGIPRGDRQAHHLHAPNDRNVPPPTASVLLPNCGD